MTATDFFIPRSLDEAVGLVREHGPELIVMGGGTITMAMINDGLLFPRKVMSLRRAGMDGVRAVDGGVVIGATTTVARLAKFDEIAILAQAARAVGGPALRTMATIGGNLFMPAPHGDLAVPLLALDAQVELAGPDGRRTLPLDQFLSGLSQGSRAPDELLAAVHVPRPSGRSAYLRYGRRQANTPAVVSVAVCVKTGADGACTEARVALGAAGPYALRARQAEAALLGRPLDATSIAAAADAAMAECDPPTDALASAWYRRKMVGVYVKRALEQVKG